MTRAVGNGLIKTLADTIGTGAVGKLAKQAAGLSTDMANIKTPDKGSGLMFNPDTGKLYIPCGNGVTVNKNTGMLEVPIGEHLRYTGSGLDVPNADETTAGVVKLTHEVSNRDDGELAITADGVYAYTSGYNTPATNVTANVDLLVPGNIGTAVVAGNILIIECYGVGDLTREKPYLHVDGYISDSYYLHGTMIGTIARPCSVSNAERGFDIQSQDNIQNPGLISIMLPVHKL